LVVKPRFGAGSQNTFLVRNRPEFDVAAQVFATENPFQQGVLQPYVSGRSLSAMALFDIQGRLVEWLPVGEQILSDDGRFHYQGGRAPAEGVAQVRIHELLTAACGALQAEPNTCLRGPIGFDVIEAAEAGELFIVDINPRFTTSYVGYRQLARHNLLAGMLGLPVSERSWRTAPVAFSVAEGDHGC
jgi:predicted ATP-grasp superfamily ATP-dependent carboligase